MKKPLLFVTVLASYNGRNTEVTAAKSTLAGSET
mgnify:CR=1 FL=1